MVWKPKIIGGGPEGRPPPMIWGGGRRPPPPNHLYMTPKSVPKTDPQTVPQTAPRGVPWDVLWVSPGGSPGGSPGESPGGSPGGSPGESSGGGPRGNPRESTKEFPGVSLGIPLWGPQGGGPVVGPGPPISPEHRSRQNTGGSQIASYQLREEVIAAVCSGGVRSVLMVSSVRTVLDASRCSYGLRLLQCSALVCGHVCARYRHALCLTIASRCAFGELLFCLWIVQCFLSRGLCTPLVCPVLPRTPLVLVL